MTPAEFKKKYGRYKGKESSGYQAHFEDLCRMLGQQTPIEADPTGSETFCYQKRVTKDAELAGGDGTDEPAERGFADVWKKGCFAFEYKGRKKNLDEAYKQLLRYRESLENPPLLVVCDFDRYIIRTNFNGTVQKTYEFTNAKIDDPCNLKVLRELFTDPERLRPIETTAQVTEDLARCIAEVARSLQERESVELEDAFTRRKLRVAQNKNLRIARFLNRIIFCFFAEDTGLLPDKLFTEVIRLGLEHPEYFSARLEELFRVMAKGGFFGARKIRQFNGHLFNDSTVFELTEDEIAKLSEASDADWQFIEPSIMGTLFERGLDPDQRTALGAHYTSREDIEALVTPVLMEPLRKEWESVRKDVREILSSVRKKAKKSTKQSAAKKSREMVEVTLPTNELNIFIKKLAATRILDPACGSGNFLYVALQMLLDLEKEVIALASEYDLEVQSQVGVQQLKAIEINPYAFELAQVSVQIGYLQWRRENGFQNDRTPVLQVLAGFENKDALLNDQFREKPKDLKAAQSEEHADDPKEKERVRVYYERAWPDCDVIVGNPPFLGDKFMRGELGDDYVKQLRKIYGDRIPGQSDLCCYWFEKARELIECGKCKRAGLLATQGIRGGASREVLKRIKESGDIFFAISDREWILDGAAVHVSMVGFDDGIYDLRCLDGTAVKSINSNLTTALDMTRAVKLAANEGVSFQGPVRVGDFDVSYDEARSLLGASNPNGRPTSDVLIPSWNGGDNTKRSRDRWVVDFFKRPVEDAAKYARPFKWVQENVRPLREAGKREGRKEHWWWHGETGDAMREAFGAQTRYVAMAQTAKHVLFRWLDCLIHPEQTLIVFARSDDYFFGIMHSRFHRLWAMSLGTQLREKESGFRYTPTTCFETFPFPFEDDLLPPKPPMKYRRGPVYHTIDSHEAEAINQVGYLVARDASADYGTKKHDGELAKDPPQLRLEIANAAGELSIQRERWMNPSEWTVEKILEFPGSVGGPWDRYIDKATVNKKTGIGTVRYPRLEPRDAKCAEELKERTLTKLYNERPAWLDFAHKKLDEAVAAAYGWPADLSDEQVLERLLALNLERAAAEAKMAPVRKSSGQPPKDDPNQTKLGI